MTIEIDGPLSEFMEAVDGGVGLTSQSFTLSAGTNDSKTFGFEPIEFLNPPDPYFGNVKPEYLSLDANQLFGSKIKITEIKQEANGERTRTISEYELYRFFDVTDSEHTDGTIEFEDTIAVEKDVTREKLIDLQTGSLQPNLSISENSAFSVSGSTIQFNPNVVELDQAGELTIENSNGELVGTLKLLGDGEPIQKWYLDEVALEQAIDEVINLNSVRNNEQDFLKEVVNGENQFIKDVISQTEAYLSPFDSGLKRSESLDRESMIFIEDFLFTPGDPAGGVDTLANANSFLSDQIKEKFDSDNNDNVNLRHQFFQIDNSRSRTENLFILSESLNENYKGEAKLYLDRYFNQNNRNILSTNPFRTDEWNRNDLIQELGTVLAHEIAHTLGLNHSFDSNTNFGTTDQRILNDIMAQGSLANLNPVKSFNYSGSAALFALGLDWNEVQGRNAVTYLRDAITSSSIFGNTNSEPTVERDNHDHDHDHDHDHNLLSSLTVDGGILWLLGNQNSYIDTINFGNVNPDGETKTSNLSIANVGDEDAIIEQVSLVDDTNQFSLEDIPENIELHPGETREITVFFDPTTTGEATAQLEIKSDALQPVVTVSVLGFGQTAEASASIEAPHNNLGGVALDGSTSELTDLATITNNGTEALSISDIKLVEGNDTFTLSNVPAGNDTNPINLEFGESFTFGDLIFDPNKEGLDRAVVEITTNDPENPVLRINAVGTGLPEVIYPEWGNDFIAIETPNLPNAPVLRTISDDEGNFEVFLPPNQDYRMVMFDPSTGLVTESFGRTPRSGQGLDLTATLVFDASTDADTDFDGLADDIEFAIGTADNNIDTDNDGLSDLVEIEQGLDPLAGRSLPTGIIGSLSLRGEANDIVVEGSTENVAEQLAYIATGSQGLAVVDASNLTNPTVLGEIELAGTATGVGVDSQLDIAAVASGYSGLHLVDISNPALPTLIQTVNVNTNHVEVYDGVAYVASRFNLKAIDLFTERSHLALPTLLMVLLIYRWLTTWLLIIKVKLQMLQLIHLL